MSQISIAGSFQAPSAKNSQNGTVFDAIPPTVIESALDQGLLVGRLGLTDRQGNPLCAAVRPPSIEWTALAAG